MIVRAYVGQNYSPDKTDGWVISGDNGPVLLTAKGDCFTVEHKISGPDWTHDFVPRFGLRTRFLVEIPKSGPGFPDAEKYLQSAEAALEKWDTKSIYANCREVASNLDAVLRTDLGPTSFAYKERWRRAYEGFNHRASLDLHLDGIKSNYPGDRTAEVSRADCEALLFSTKILLKYAVDLTT
jgi:hypothetical protein